MNELVQHIPLMWRIVIFVVWAVPLLYLGLVWRGWAREWWQTLKALVLGLVSYVRDLAREEGSNGG